MPGYEPPTDGHYHTGYTMFRFYIMGKPDTRGWRDKFASMGKTAGLGVDREILADDWKPLPYEGNIYPQWAIKDYFYLINQNPEWITIFLRLDIPKFPPLEVLVNSIT